jgi:hypothetical protein
MPRAMPRRPLPADTCIRVRATHSHALDWCYCFCCEQVFQLRETVIEVSHDTEHLGYLCPKCQGSTAAQLRPKLFQLATALEQKAQHLQALALLEIRPLSSDQAAHAAALMDQCFDCRQKSTLREIC